MVHPTTRWAIREPPSNAPLSLSACTWIGTGTWWHIAGCQEFHDFRLDRIVHLQLSDDTFAPHPETLQQYWQKQAARWPTKRP
ncbi:WYL domain-containing protein [Hymenobacter sp. BT664]|uniref:WYL domain-containing protein n=1 Tax=Hymenobacter montanus TaxID=2771359 RepID=A0A927BCR5_9BACT|nr:WYL domain-containing protein [Hymenobacter montanus]